MGFLHLIKEDHRIRVSADFFTQLSAALVSHISWRGSDHLGNAVLLHILRHIYTDQGILRTEHGFRKGFAEFRLSDTCGS